MFDVMVKLAKKGIDVRLVDYNIYEITGFYKSGTILVNLDEQTIKSRYDEFVHFEEDDLLVKLVECNFDWWLRSKDRYDGWMYMDKPWQELYEELNI